MEKARSGGGGKGQNEWEGLLQISTKLQLANVKER